MSKKSELLAEVQVLRADNDRLTKQINSLSTPPPGRKPTVRDVSELVYLKVRNATYRGASDMVNVILNSLSQCGYTKEEIRNALDLND